MDEAIEKRGYSEVMGPEEMLKQVTLIQQVMAAVMKEGEHYGKIPGCDKPSLYKSGAEKLNFTFRLYPDFEILEKISTDDFVQYLTKCTLRHIQTGEVWGTSIKSCSSKEKKYRYRSVPLKKATEYEKSIQIREETRKGQYGEYKVLIIPQDARDVENTVLAMSQKRGFVGAILAATAASDIFTQDIEDMDHPSENEGNGRKKKPPVSTPKAKKKAAPASKQKDEVAPSSNPAAIGVEEKNHIIEDLKGAGIAISQMLKDLGFLSINDIKFSDMDKIKGYIDNA